MLRMVLLFQTGPKEVLREIRYSCLYIGNQPMHGWGAKIFRDYPRHDA
jgi:hypothetical protein